MARPNTAVIRLSHESPYDLDQLLLCPQPWQQTATIDRYINMYAELGRRETEAMLGRATYYFPIFEHYLLKAGMPTALKYLPFVESALNPQVTSNSGAAGLWQLMPQTATHFGLTINEQFDERRDPHAATAAAVTFLAELHEEFCDWFLVLAAYNCGPGKVRRAIQKTGQSSFAAIQPLLPRQTRNYIDKFIAAAYIGNAYRDHSLEPKLPKWAESISVMHIEGGVALAELASLCAIPEAVLRELNPAYTGQYLPSHSRLQRLILPASAIATYQLALATRENPVAVEDVMPVLELPTLLIVGQSQLPQKQWAPFPALALSHPTPPTQKKEPQVKHLYFVRRLMSA